jgi:hypothetical protein
MLTHEGPGSGASRGLGETFGCLPGRPQNTPTPLPRQVHHSYCGRAFAAWSEGIVDRIRCNDDLLTAAIGRGSSHLISAETDAGGAA